ncbi:MAG: hypothetical protein Tsb0032_07940 [Kiloniellaceae bacterium]
MPATSGAQETARDYTWQDAVAELAGERTRAESCARLLKISADNDEAALHRGEIAYSDAKAEVDAVIAGLVVVLAQRGLPPKLSDLEARLSNGVKKREAFCTDVVENSSGDRGSKNIIVDVLGAAFEPLLDAVVEIYKFESEKSMLTRKTIQTQLEATKWSSFAEIKA